MTCPDRGVKAAAMSCSKVVFPAPDGPITATCSPCPIDSERSVMAEGASRVAAGWRPSTWSKVMFTAMPERNGSESDYLMSPALRPAFSKPL